MRRETTLAFPDVPLLMMVSAGGKERRLLSKTLRDLEAEHFPIKPERPLQISDLQMNMADADIRMHRH